MESKDYPSELLRGISAKGFVTEEGYILPSAFQFSNYDEEARNGDGYCELSINWNDDNGALSTLLEQRKNNSDEFQFKVGYCKIARKKIDENFNIYKTDSIFSYERRPLQNDEGVCINPYHGNLLLKTDNKQIRKIVEHSLALFAGMVIYRESEEGNIG